MDIILGVAFAFLGMLFIFDIWIIMMLLDIIEDRPKK
jgi:hypothetical protein